MRNVPHARPPGAYTIYYMLYMYIYIKFMQTGCRPTTPLLLSYNCTPRLLRLRHIHLSIRVPWHTLLAVFASSKFCLKLAIHIRHHLIYKICLYQLCISVRKKIYCYRLIEKLKVVVWTCIWLSWLLLHFDISQVRLFR